MAAPSNFVNAVAITTSDATIYNPPLAALLVQGTGNLRVITVGGQDITFTAVPAFFTLYLKVKQVMATSTTATGIVGLS